MRNDSAAPPYPVAGADHALRTLLLLHERGELRVADVARHLEVARSTAHRTLAMLVFRGLAEQDARRAYRPGPALRALSRPPGPPDLVSVARPHLERLAAAVCETTHLLVLEGTGSRFLDGVEGPQVLRVGARTGMLLPAYATAGGKALLAELSAGQAAAAVPPGPPGGLEPARLARELSLARRRGYAAIIEEGERGVSAVAACVRDGAGRAVAAVCVAAPSVRCPRARLADLGGHVIRSARDISAGL